MQVTLTSKCQQREYYKKLRKKIDNFDKSAKDSLIYRNLINHPIFEDSNCFLVYVSNTFEIDTIELIKYLLKNKKTVAAPRCIGGSGSNDMEFFFIKSINDLEKGSFDILEPNANMHAVNIDESSFTRPVCIVPGICYDQLGYRIGYGKGYYDNYFLKYNIHKIGLCYDDFVINHIFIDNFDVNVDILITDKRVINIKKER